MFVHNAVLSFAVLWIPLSSCHSCPFVSPPVFLVRAHLVLLVTKLQVSAKDDMFSRRFYLVAGLGV
jgi:hypothetical protein